MLAQTPGLRPTTGPRCFPAGLPPCASRAGPWPRAFLRSVPRR